MKILLDECVDWRLARDLSGHEVNTAGQMGWAALKNGELLALAGQYFDVFVTVDRNLPFQQNVPGLKIAVIVLQVQSSRLVDLRPLIPALLSALPGLEPGTVTTVSL
jgi:hypothetical protein